MKKILLLGGSAQQVIAIETAKKLGYYTILCDFLPDNPGQHVADKFYPASTTDKEAVLDIAKREQVHGVLAYASDPAAPTAAYVAECLGLSGNPYRSVDILCDKAKFRSFLKMHNFCTPDASGYDSAVSALADLAEGRFRYPVIVKPVDSSGSKGVSQINCLDEARTKIEYAMSFSREGKIIVEEYVEKYGYQIAGDGLSIDGKLVFRYFANDHFNPKCVNPFVPISASFPYNMPGSVHDKIHYEIQRLISELNMGSSTYNFDVRIDKDHNVYLMEVAPRNGGNYIPNVIQYATGIDLIEYSVRVAMGETVEIPNARSTTSGYWSYFAVHSLSDGILENIEIDEDVVKNNIVESHIIKKRGDRIKAFVGANTTLGCLIMRFDSMEEMLDRMDHSLQWCRVIVREERVI